MKSFIRVFIALFIYTGMSSQVNVLWQSRYTYNGTGNFIDQVRDMATDAAGNVYVTGIGRGVSNFDYATVKYNSTGVFQWVALYNGAGNSLDESRAVAVDVNGNVYVTGWSAATATNYNCVTVKYNSAGVQQWASSYDRAGLNDEGKDIALDALGAPYICGISESATNLDDYLVAKLNPATGAVTWQANFSTVRLDQAIRLTTDAANAVYVTGQSETTTSSGFDIVTIKYNTAGAQQWVNTYANVATGDDQPTDIAVNAAGEAFVTGWSLTLGGSTDFDCITLKTTAAGAASWNQRYGTTVGDDDQGNAIHLDVNGDVLITGKYFTSLTTQDIMVGKYNKTTGAPFWRVTYNSPSNDYDEGRAITTDATGDVYVTGYSNRGSQSNNFSTLKFKAATGVLDWLIFYNGTGNGSDKTEAVRLDAQNNVIVAGTSKGLGTNDDFETIKYCQFKATGGKDTTMCLNGSQPLNGTTTGAVTYAWSDTTGATYGSSPTLIVTPGATMNYVLTVTNAIGCVDYDTVRVVVLPLPGPVITPSGPTTFCIGNSVTLNSSPYTAYLWSPGGATTQTITVNSSNNYSVLVTDVNFCQSLSTINVVVNPLPNITTVNDTGFCSGNPSLLLCATGGTSYTWTDGPLNTISDTTIACPNFAPSALTQYIVVGTDANGCKNSDTVNINVFSPPTPPNISWILNSTLQTTSGTTYQWYDFNCLNSSSTPIVGETNQTFVPLVNGCYIVEITDANGCSSFSSPYVVNGVGINEVNGSIGFGLFPNPAMNEVTINAINSSSTQALVRILTIEGKEMFNQSIKFASQTRQVISLSSYEAGIYFIEISNENGQKSVKKLVIEK